MNLDSLEQTLTQKFTALEKLMAGLNAQSQFLSSQFGA
jgi:flagellar capping protein FliD